MTDVATNLNTIDDSLSDIKTSIVNKGGTVSGNITTFATAIDNIPSSSPVITSLPITPTTSAQTITAPSGTDGYSPITVSAVTSSIDANIVAGNIKKDVTILGVTGSYEGSGGGSYQLHRVKNSSNVEIGTAFMEFEDGSGNKYDVVCLDAQYRSDNGAYCSNSTNVIPNLPTYYSTTANYRNWWYDNAKETATFNTQKIIDYAATSGEITSLACDHCRNFSAIINGVTYYGQLPNMREVFEMWKNRTQLESMDPTASSYYLVNFSGSRNIISSTQWNAAGCIALTKTGFINANSKSDNNVYTFPVLEIPKS